MSNPITRQASLFLKLSYAYAELQTFMPAHKHFTIRNCVYKVFTCCLSAEKPARTHVKYHAAVNKHETCTLEVQVRLVLHQHRVPDWMCLPQ